MIRYKLPSPLCLALLLASITLCQGQVRPSAQPSGPYTFAHMLADHAPTDSLQALIDKAEAANDFPACLRLLDQLPARTGLLSEQADWHIGRAYYFYHAAQPDSTLRELEKAFTSGARLSMYGESLEADLQDPSFWGRVQQLEHTCLTTGKVAYNQMLRDSIDRMHTLDQELRVGTSWEHAPRSVLRRDSINQEALWRITQQYGYPGQVLTGGGLGADVILLHARDSAYIARMIPFVYQAVTHHQTFWAAFYSIYGKLLRQPVKADGIFRMPWTEFDANGQPASDNLDFYLNALVANRAQLSFPANPRHNRLRTLRAGGHILRPIEFVYLVYPGEPEPDPAVVNNVMTYVRDYCLSFGIAPADIQIAPQPVVHLPACDHHYGCARIGFRDLKITDKDDE